MTHQQADLVQDQRVEQQHEQQDRQDQPQHQQIRLARPARHAQRGSAWCRTGPARRRRRTAATNGSRMRGEQVAAATHSGHQHGRPAADKPLRARLPIARAAGWRAGASASMSFTTADPGRGPCARRRRRPNTSVEPVPPARPAPAGAGPAQRSKAVQAPAPRRQARSGARCSPFETIKRLDLRRSGWSSTAERPRPRSRGRGTPPGSPASPATGRWPARVTYIPTISVLSASGSSTAPNADAALPRRASQPSTASEMPASDEQDERRAENGGATPARLPHGTAHSRAKLMTYWGASDRCPDRPDHSRRQAWTRTASGG